MKISDQYQKERFQGFIMQAVERMRWFFICFDENLAIEKRKDTDVMSESSRSMLTWQSASRSISLMDKILNCASI